MKFQTIDVEGVEIQLTSFLDGVEVRVGSASHWVRPLTRWDRIFGRTMEDRVVSAANILVKRHLKLIGGALVVEEVLAAVADELRGEGRCLTPTG